MNTIILTGRLTRDPEVRYTSGEDPICCADFDLAVTRTQDTTDFIKCAAYRKTGEIAEKYLRKGMLIALRGSLYQKNWTNKNGDKITSYQVTVNEITFLEKKSDTSDSKKKDDGFIDIPDGIDNELLFN